MKKLLLGIVVAILYSTYKVKKMEIGPCSMQLDEESWNANHPKEVKENNINEEELPANK